MRAFSYIGLALGMSLLVSSAVTALQEAGDAQSPEMSPVQVKPLGEDKEACLALVQAYYRAQCGDRASEEASYQPLGRNLVSGQYVRHEDPGYERRKGMVAGAILGGLAGGEIGGRNDEIEGVIAGALLGGFLGSRKGAAPDRQALEEHYRRLEANRHLNLDLHRTLTPGRTRGVVIDPLPIPEPN